MVKSGILNSVLLALGCIVSLSYAETTRDAQATTDSRSATTEQSVRLRKAHYALSVRKARIRKSLIILSKLTEQKPPKKFSAEQTNDWHSQNRLLLQVYSEFRSFHDKEMQAIKRPEPNRDQNRQVEVELPKYQALDQKFLTLYDTARRKIEDYHGLTQFTQQRNEAALTAITQIKG